MNTTTEQDTRMSLRVSRESKARVECAAAVSGQSLSGFAASALARAADEVLERHSTLILGDEEPLEKSKAAATRYR